MEDSKIKLIIRSLETELSEKEISELGTWRNHRPEHEQQYQETKFLWEKAQLAKTKVELSIDKKAAFKKVQSKIGKHKVVSIRRNFFKWAAAVLILLGTGFAYQTFNKQADVIMLVTSANEQKEIKLPDDSKVWMNENSTISYSAEFAGNYREVKMEGDVVFEVTPNPSKPFIVRSNEHEVSVLGTKFNVFTPRKSASNDSKINVHVFHGKVKVSKVNDEKSGLILTKGMTAGYVQDKLSIVEDYFPNAHYWQTEILVFKNQSLQTVIKEIEAAYEINIDLEDEKLLTCNFTGKFKSQKIDEVMEILAEVLKLDITKLDSTNFKITGGSCN